MNKEQSADEDIFGLEEKTNVVANIDSNQKTNQEQNNIVEVKDSQVPESDYSATNCIQKLLGENIPKKFMDIDKRIQSEYSRLPKIVYDDIYKELSDLSIKSSPNPVLQTINDEIQRIQAAKDRLSEIFIDVFKCYVFKKRAVDILIDSWSKFSEEKSQDRRKSEATYITSNYSIDFALTESLLKACSHILKNLDSAHESLSRRITVIQLTIKLRDIGRGNAPYDFESESNKIGNIDDFTKEESKIDPKESIVPEINEDF